jgi:hypothetical protein
MIKEYYVQGQIFLKSLTIILIFIINFSMSTDIERNISEKIVGLLKVQGIKRKPFAEKAGIDIGNFYRILKGERGWTITSLEKTATALNVSLYQVLPDTPGVALVAKLEEDGFNYEDIGKSNIRDVPFISFGKVAAAGEVYALEIAGKFYSPFQQGNIIYLKIGIAITGFKDGDYVIYCRENGRGCLWQISISDNNQIILKSMAQGRKDIVVPKSHLQLCHKLIQINFS